MPVFIEGQSCIFTTWGKTKENASSCFRRPPPEELGRANSETCDVTQDLQKERGKSHIKVVKLDPPLSESDRSGFLIDDFDMAFAMFFLDRVRADKNSMGDSSGGTLLVYVPLV